MNFQITRNKSLMVKTLVLIIFITTQFITFAQDAKPVQQKKDLNQTKYIPNAEVMEFDIKVADVSAIKKNKNELAEEADRHRAEAVKLEDQGDKEGAKILKERILRIEERIKAVNREFRVKYDNQQQELIKQKEVNNQNN